MLQKRRAWNGAIEKAKAVHWKQFLDEVGEGNLWKAATYMKPRDSFASIPAIKVATEELTSNKDKAQAFRDAFFPTMADAEEHSSTQPLPEISWQPITELEVYRSLKPVVDANICCRPHN